MQVGYGNETPAEMPKPLYVGQRVMARHPITRHLHDGDVLTVAPNCYRWPRIYGLLVDLPLQPAAACRSEIQPQI